MTSVWTMPTCWGSPMAVPSPSSSPVDAPARVRRLVLVSTSCGVGSIPSTRDALRSLATPRDGIVWPRPDVLSAFWHSLAISTWSSIPFLGAIRAPTLVVCGSRDRIAPPANSRLLARRIPGATLVMLPAGHDLQRAVRERAGERSGVVLGRSGQFSVRNGLASARLRLARPEHLDARRGAVGHGRTLAASS